MPLRSQVYKLMLPHFRYTMHINANARSILINADGTLEQTFTSGKYTMELASVVYEKLYHFETQSLEADLILRCALSQLLLCCVSLYTMMKKNRVYLQGSVSRNLNTSTQPIVSMPQQASRNFWAIIPRNAARAASSPASCLAGRCIRAAQS